MKMLFKQDLRKIHPWQERYRQRSILYYIDHLAVSFLHRAGDGTKYYSHQGSCYER